MSFPFVTIIMPVRNEAEHIERSLGSVLGQDYPSDTMEVIVADGMSTDGTVERILELADSGEVAVTVLENPGQIVPTGMNVAMRRAKGDVIVRVDGHCEVRPDYVSRCVLHLDKDGVDGVGGVIETVGETYVAQAVSAAMCSLFGIGGSAFRTGSVGSGLVDTIPFPAYTKRIMKRAGLYDEELVRNQDDEYNHRLRKLGAKLLLADDVASRYYSRSSLKDLWRQYFQYGFWKVRVLQKHPRQMRVRQFVPPAFVGALIALFVLSLLFLGCFPLLLGVMGAYVVANAVSSLWVSRKKGWKYLPLLPVVFAILHVSYGLGFLIGLFRFIHRWGDKEGKIPAWEVADA